MTTEMEGPSFLYSLVSGSLLYRNALIEASLFCSFRSCEIVMALLALLVSSLIEDKMLAPVLLAIVARCHKVTNDL